MTQVSFGEFAQAAQGRRYSGLFLWSCRARDAFSDLSAAFTPRFESSGVVNAARQSPDAPLAPLCWTSVYGVNLSLRFTPATGNALPEQLDNVVVSVVDSEVSTVSLDWGLCRPARSIF
jgi:hypothetical protein